MRPAATGWSPFPPTYPDWHVTRLLLLLLAVYKRLISPWLGQRCRFHPTCSAYARIAVVRFGPVRGIVLTAWRLMRCHPLCEGGHDPVPTTFTFVGCHRKHEEHAQAASPHRD